jgi:hypothetical protein
MAESSLVERKIEASQQLIRQLEAQRAPLLAAYWEFAPEKDRWILYLVPKSAELERESLAAISKTMSSPPYRSVFSLSDVFVDAQQIPRARAIGTYLRSPEDWGRQFDTTFTGGHYFESVIVLYIAPELRSAHTAA